MIAALLIICAGCMGYLAGWVSQCERFHYMKRQRNRAWKHLDAAHVELAQYRREDLHLLFEVDRYDRLLATTPERAL